MQLPKGYFHCSGVSLSLLAFSFANQIDHVVNWFEFVADTVYRNLGDNSGEIVEIGPRERIFSDPQHPYTRRLLAAVPEPDPARRLTRRKLEPSELRNPIHPKDFRPPLRAYSEVSPGHLVMQTD